MTKTHIRPLTAYPLMIGSILLLSACTSLTDLGNAVDRPPVGTDASAPVADSNGVITYPNYQVAVARSGDTVGSVANRIGIDAVALASYNGLSTTSNLNQDQVLILPPGSDVGGTGLEEIAGEALDSAPDSAPIPRDAGNEPLRHVVEQGETAYDIARRYNVSVTSLASWNGLGPNLELRTGQRLLIPASGVAAPQPAPDPIPRVSEPTPQPTTPSEPEPAPAPTSSKGFTPPVDGKVLRPYSKKSGGNEGIDYAAPTGTSVRAAGDGQVALISKSVGNTTIVLLRHGNGLYTVYSNINSVTLKKGDQVKRGQTVGKVAGGNPSFVHFEVRKGTQAVDPAPYL